MLVVFTDGKLAQRYAGRRIPMATLHEAYLDGRVDIPDIDAFLDARRELVAFTLTGEHVRFLLTRMIPEWLLHSKSQDRRIVRDHYDRGDDFFQAFLGDSMVYTGGFFRDPGESLEQAQRNKMDLVCHKLMVRPGHELLDIGCGWGTLVATPRSTSAHARWGSPLPRRAPPLETRASRARASRSARASSASTTATLPGGNMIES